ncbi:MAG: ABC transporter ATP-binding protein, partial [Clostridia bacterium]
MEMMERGIKNINKPKKKTYILLRLWGYFREYSWLVVLAIILAFAGNFFGLLGPMLSGYAIDAIAPGPGNVIFETVFKYTALMIAFYAASALMSYVLSILLINLSRKIVYKMRKDVFDKLCSLPVGFFDKHQTGDIISIISYDIDTINTSLSNDLLQIFTSVITVVGSFIMMLTISPLLILVFVITIPISILFTRYRAKKIRPLYNARSGKLGALNGFVEENASGQKTVRAYNREIESIAKFDEKNDDAVNAYFNADYFSSGMGPTVNFINNLSLALISIFGAILYMSSGITLGNISSFVLYSRKFSGPINEFANIMTELQSAFAASERVFSLIDMESEPADDEDADDLINPEGDINMDNVSFSYDKTKMVIENLNLTAKQGSTIAIVGPTGAGKTTIINLLMRFYDVDKGIITVDGADIKHVTRKSLRSAYTMVLQDTWLFYGTIYENIAYGRENVTMDDVVRAAKAAKIHDFIMQQKYGYDTVLKDNAVNISKGQKQLLTIARSMLLDSPMLILDEATSNVDTQTERSIQEAMLSLMKNRTCFVIAHRLSTIEN